MSFEAPAAPPDHPNQVNDHKRARLEVLFGILLLLVTVLVYRKVGSFGFVNFDDAEYVFQNPHVLSGLSWETIRWAFLSPEVANWHPLTWLSLASDVSLFGADPGVFHRVNLAFHALNTLLCLYLFKKITGRFWTGAVIAALFALHPLHVESVVWISERKDVLSTLFWLLATLSYVDYARKSSVKSYLLTFFLMVMGLMAKPMLVTLPITFLLLDYWPLQRLDGPSPNPVKTFLALVMEKMPFFLLAAASCGMTIWAQRLYGALQGNALISIGHRVTNAVHSVLRYLMLMLWPSKLAVFYPHPNENLNLANSVLPCLVVVGLSIVVWIYRRRFPYLVTGWCWFLVTLLPVIGLVQAGSQGMADRYTYIPLLGPFLILAMGARDAQQRWRIPAGVIVTMAVLPFAALAIVTSLQINYWRDTITLFSHADQVTRGNWLAREQLAQAYFDRGRFADSIRQSERALQIADFREGNQIRIGDALCGLGRGAEALEFYASAQKLNPKLLVPSFKMACVLMESGRGEEALPYFEMVTKAKPGQLGTYPLFVRSALRYSHMSLGINFRAQGQLDLALAQFQAAVKVDPQYLKAALNLGITLGLLGRHEEALACFRACVVQAPNDLVARHYLGRELRNAGQWAEARSVFEAILRVDPGFEQARKELSTLPSMGQGPKQASPISKATAPGL